MNEPVRKTDFRPSADRRSIIPYPGGHVVRINRPHLELVLAVKASALSSGKGEGE